MASDSACMPCPLHNMMREKGWGSQRDLVFQSWKTSLLQWHHWLWYIRHTRKYFYETHRSYFVLALLFCVENMFLKEINWAWCKNHISRNRCIPQMACTYEWFQRICGTYKIILVINVVFVYSVRVVQTGAMCRYPENLFFSNREIFLWIYLNFEYLRIK